MAGIIETVLVTSGLSVYAHIRNNTGQIWNGSSFETYNSSNWSSYSISMTEQSGSGYYKATFPAAITAGIYNFVVYVGNPPTLGDQPYDSGTMDWSGSVENYIGLITVKLPSGNISSFDPTTQSVNLNANQTGVTIGSVNSLGSSAQSSVKSQIDASLGSDIVPELTGVPSSTPTLKQAVMLLFMALRNKRTSDASTVKIYNNSGALIATASQSDNGAIYTKENFL